MGACGVFFVGGPFGSDLYAMGSSSCTLLFIKANHSEEDKFLRLTPTVVSSNELQISARIIVEM